MGSDEYFHEKFLIYFGISRFWLHLPIWVIFYSSKGFSLFEVALLSNVMWVTVILFEIPTGYIADKLGRKISVVLSYVIQTCGIAVFVVSTEILFLILAQFLWGVGIT